MMTTPTFINNFVFIWKFWYITIRGGVWVFGRCLGDRQIVLVIEKCATLSEMYDVALQTIEGILGQVMIWDFLNLLLSSWVGERWSKSHGEVEFIWLSVIVESNSMRCRQEKAFISLKGKTWGRVRVRFKATFYCRSICILMFYTSLTNTTKTIWYCLLYIV